MFIYQIVLKTPMDLTSLYLRTFFGGRPFKSSELDSLAEMMGVAGQLSPNLGQRYFLLRAGRVAAANVGNKIVFGERFYRQLTNEQLLAVAAHEFAHSTHHNERARTASASLAISAALAFTALVGMGSVLIAEAAFVASFFPLMGGLSYVFGRSGRDEESKCDALAASFAGREAMAASILLAQEMSTRRFRLWSRNRNSSLDERARRLVGDSNLAA